MATIHITCDDHAAQVLSYDRFALVRMMLYQHIR
jgi:hypothetical protein